ncbi:MAG: ABC transporter permease [Eubacteriaceae bacterium]
MDNLETMIPILQETKRPYFNQRKKTLFILIFSLCLLIGITIMGLLLTDAAMVTDFTEKNLPPSLSHPFGTDWMGRDLLILTFKGLSTSILIGVFASTMSGIIAGVLGSMAAILGKKVDSVITWVIDLVMGIPHIVLLVLISYALGKGFWGVAVGVSLTHWPSLARVIRGEVLQIKEAPYVKVASKLGKKPFEIATKHMIPHVFPQFVVGLILLFPHAILHEAAVTFLGFGLSPEQPAIGVILSGSMAYLSSGMWWQAFFPGVALIFIVVLFDMLGGSLGKLMNPNSAQE